MIIQVHGNLCFLGLKSRCLCFLKVVTSMGCVLLLARSWWKLACNQILSNSRTKARSAKLSKRVFVVFVFISTSGAIFVYTNPLQTCKFVVQTPRFCIILIFFWRKPLLFQRFYLPLPPKSLPAWGWEHKKLTSMERDLRPFVRPVSKGRFRTLLSVRSNLATLNLNAAVMQQKRPRGLILYLPAAIIFPFYIY